MRFNKWTNLVSILISLATLALTSPLIYELWFSARLVANYCVVDSPNYVDLEEGENLTLLVIKNDGWKSAKSIEGQFLLHKDARIELNDRGLNASFVKVDSPKNERKSNNLVVRRFIIETVSDRYRLLIPHLPSGSQVSIRTFARPVFCCAGATINFPYVQFLYLGNKDIDIRRTYIPPDPDRETPGVWLCDAG